MPTIRVLIVDDAVVVRQLVSKALSVDPELDVVGVAANGRIALAKIPQVNPDVIVLDLAMPEMDGLEMLKSLRETYPKLPVIMFSALTERGAVETLDALALGATDYITKPVSKNKDEAMQYIQAQLIPRLKVFCPTGVMTPSKPIGLRTQVTSRSHPTTRLPTTRLSTTPTHPVDILAIGVSTGGPNALTALFSALPADLPVPIVIVQHMPPLFTKRLAERLTAQGQLPVTEGASGSVLHPSKAWMAPGDFHMVVQREGTLVTLQLHQAPPENSCRPSVDVLFRSVAKTYGPGTLGLVLTGMGQDGLNGCEYIREVGGQILVQDEASSVVWGMPGIVAQAGLANQVLPLEQMAGEVVKRVGRCG
ncbi:MAG: chemotaxis response regulator protein-glutamate methylesterase [Cyanobacteria bacterium P01_F01_bin.4]